MKKYIALLIFTITTIQYSFSQCQTIIPDINPLMTGTPAVDPDTGEEFFYYDICQGESISFEGTGDYPESGTTYVQSDATSTFTWTNNGGSPETGQNATYTFSDGGGYIVNLEIEDVNGCTNTVIAKIYVRVSTTPIIDLTAAPLVVCPNTESELNAVVEFEPTPWSAGYVNTFADELFIPDGPACPPGAYETTIEFNTFLPGQTLTDVDDFTQICIEMEHSFMGDLTINLIAPDGSTVVLLADENGTGVGNGLGGNNLGEPGGTDSWSDSCDGDENPAGEGYIYCWSPNPTTDTWHDLDDAGSLGNPVDASIVASSTNIYSAYDESFDDILGTDLNGDWTVEVIDTWGADNGWIFQWWIDFNPEILPSDWGFTPTIVNSEWASSASTVSIAGDLMTINPPTAGNYTYNYAIEDDFGCTYQSSVVVQALNGVELLNVISIPDECAIGVGSATVEGFGGTEPYQYAWPSIGLTGPTATGLNSGSYPYTITDALGCVFQGVAFVDQEGLEVELELIELTDDACEIGVGTMLVEATNGIPPFSYNWDGSGSGSALGTNLLTGDQTVTVTDGNGCVGELTEFIGNIPPPTASFSFYLDSCTNELNLFNETPNSTQSQWDLGVNGVSYEDNPMVHLNYGAIYPITLIASHEYCSDSVTDIIDLSISNITDRIKFPNTFTPNGDAKNDLFTIRGLKDCDAGVLRIFNRWGGEVYYSIYPRTEPWDGKHLSDEVIDGVYFYVLELKYAQIKGSVTLLR